MIVLSVLLLAGALKGRRWNLTSEAEAACSILGSRFGTATLVNAAPSDWAPESAFSRLSGTEAGLQTSGAEAACSILGSRFGTATLVNAAPSDWAPSRLLADFQELRQDFSPPKPDASNFECSRCVATRAARLCCRDFRRRSTALRKSVFRYGSPNHSRRPCASRERAIPAVSDGRRAGRRSCWCGRLYPVSRAVAVFRAGRLWRS